MQQCRSPVAGLVTTELKSHLTVAFITAEPVSSSHSIDPDLYNTKGPQQCIGLGRKTRYFTVSGHEGEGRTADGSLPPIY